MKKIDPKIELLIFRFLQGELSGEKREELDGWLRDEKHQAWFENICNKEHILQKSFHFDRLNKGREESWKYLEKKIGWGGHRVIRRWMTVAASLMIPLLLGVLGYYMLWNTVPLEQTKYGGIVPGVPTAKLYLSNGQVVNLGQDSVYSLKLADGGMFLNEQETLTYQKDSTVKNVMSYSELRIPRGGEYKIVLPDGTIVWLNAESSLRFPNKFTGKERKVYATGELYFKVARDENCPFKVEIGEDYTVEVLGTEFNTRAYQNGHRATTLVKGSVRVQRNGEEIKLQPGQQAVETEEGKKLLVKEVDVASYIAWHEGLFCFEHTPLREIMEELARWYNVQVLFENETMKEECFSLEMKRFDDFNRVISLIERTRMVNITVKDSVVTIK